MKREHEQSNSEPCAERTAGAVFVLKTDCRGFRITSTLNREPFLSDTSDLRTDDLMILRMLVIFQADEKCDNIKHILFFLKINVSDLCTLFS